MIALTLQSVAKHVQDLIFGGKFWIECRLVRRPRQARRRIMSRTAWSVRACPAGLAGRRVTVAAPFRGDA